MENQHRQIKGYTEFNQETIDKMNKVKEYGAKWGEVIAELESDENVDKRWLEIGKAQMQQGLMAVTRSIAKPKFF